jgi:hypothetical protein
MCILDLVHVASKMSNLHTVEALVSGHPRGAKKCP